MTKYLYFDAFISSAIADLAECVPYKNACYSADQVLGMHQDCGL